MLAFILTTIFCFVVWLLLTFNGEIWGTDEIIAGIIFSVIGGVVARKIFIKDFKMANPKRWALFLAYLPRFFYEMAKANFDVAYRVITGKINPGIVKISPNLKSDFSLTLLANSITLTPGTLSVDVDNEKNLYVHWINVKDEVLEKMPRDYKPICSTFPDWARRIGE
ncbi:MAG: cation:proton antiporter [Thermoplasmata archaeon]|nr:MAG: cation:proton antiporter [Thermoplasmata archaeon]KAA0015180.1 MAG: cation:proton antiporter [Thermoplasmata archaeon]OYT61742.1 MAG: cation:proton antiporter [Thermoplasmatales archaeon ex4484_30]